VLGRNGQVNPLACSDKLDLVALPANWGPRETTLRLNSVADKVLFWGILGATVSAGLALWDAKSIWPTSDLSGLRDFLARSAPYVLCLVLLRYPHVRARAFGAGLACLTAVLRAIHVGYWLVFLSMVVIFAGGLYSPVLVGLTLLVVFSLASNLLVFGVAVYQSGSYSSATRFFAIGVLLAAMCIPLSCHGPNFPP
jgi:ABC-type xylose transport system permease subunit